MTTTITIEARKQAIQAAVQAADAASRAGNGTSESIRWKTGQLILPVASVDVDVVLLSRDSHRIKAQLQSLPQAEQDLVESDPYGVQAQEIIARLLRETAGYERIKSAIANDGQLDAGVLTTGGVLVNANTRVVALRELRQKYVKVVVLPEDAGPKEITELELRLQMEQEVKQPYSFTSQLLFIEDLVNSGNYTTAEIGRALQPGLTNSRTDLKKAVDLVEGELRLLSLIREVLAMSGGALNLLYFDGKQQALFEIDQDYQKIKNTKPEQAARVRDAQLAGMIAEIGYRELRDVDAVLLDEYVGPALEEDVILAPHLDALLEVTASEGDSALEGLDLLGDEADDEPLNGEFSLSGIYTLLARTKPEEHITLPTEDGTVANLSREVVVTGLRGALTTAIENKKRDTRQLDRLTAPMLHLKEAAKALDSATVAYAEVSSRAGFRQTDFLKAVAEYQRAATNFSMSTGLGDGVEGDDLAGDADLENTRA
ncbi:hypothetical protein AB0N24_23555 [Arthrobacter sp. NPDC093128]|uniref:hypothetical protein n=1 Tax=Arthrobacter sp. NPDC093128 TaxID=3154979 RepID=UPI003413CD97